MRTMTKKLLLAVLPMIFLGMISATQVAGANKPRNPSQEPNYLDLYIVQGPRTVPLQQGNLTFRTALSVGFDKAGLYGIPTPPKTRLDLKPLEIMVFDPEGAGAAMQLAKLGRIDTAPAHTFDLKTTKTGPAIFEEIYQVKYDEALPINLWCVESNIPLQIIPLAKKPGWYRAVPEQPLEGGVYAINFGCADGPRIYTGDLNFYPFVVASGPDSPPPGKKLQRRGKRRAPARPGVARPPAPKPRPPAPAPPLAAPQMDADLNYVATPSPPGRREYRITNTNKVPWHNVNISVYIRDAQFPATLLGPVTLYKDVVLPAHTVSQVPDKTMLQYETISDAGAKLYLKINCKEGVIKKAWQNVSLGESGQAALVEVPWDLMEGGD